MVTTKVYKGFQLHVPKEIRQKHNITEDDQVSWRSEWDDIILKCQKAKKFKRFGWFGYSKKRI